MIKKILISLTLLSVFLNVVSVSLAQEAEPTKRWFCFEADRDSVHGAKLFIKDGAPAEDRPLANHETIVVECIATEEGQKCTTGNGGLDQDLYGGSQMGGLGYEFQGMFTEDGQTPLTNPIPGNDSGTLAPIVWRDATDRAHDRKWLGLNLVQPKPDVEMGLGGEQLGTFDFEFALKKCAMISWDPFGRIFDSQNLEPVSGASVTLLKKRENGIFTYVNPADPADVPGGALINPMTTLEDGGFSFVVPDGTYKLSVQKSEYGFPSALTLNPSYTKAYSDIYPAETGAEIVQAGVIQHRDIPLDSQSGPVSTPAKVMEYIYESDKLGNLLLTGHVSHPLAVVNLYSVVPDANDSTIKTRYRLISTISSDSKGNFSATIDQSDFDSEIAETFGEVEATSVDLTLASKQNLLDRAIGFIERLVIREIQAQTGSNVLKLDPIPSYLEGYAYDETGDTMANATVAIYLKFAKKPYYQTKADENGFFKINSDYIPFEPYNLRYSSSTGAVVNVTTAKFLSDNRIYIKENGINNYRPNYVDPKVNQRIEAKLTQAAEAAAQVQNSTANGQNNPQGVGGGTTSMAFIAIVALIVVLLISAGTVVLYMVKKNSDRPY